MKTVKSVWITDSCIICSVCQSIAPKVFNCDDEYAHILKSVRQDNLTDMNPNHSPLIEVAQQYSDDIVDAAEGCPVEAIIIEY